MKLEIKKIGNSTGLILPKELLARLGLEQGDQVFVTFEPDQSFKVSVHEDKHARVMQIAREVMREYRHALKELAK